MNWYGQKVARLQYMWQDPRVDIWINTLTGKPVFQKIIGNRLHSSPIREENNRDDQSEYKL
jgi:hypothetical protein